MYNESYLSLGGALVTLPNGTKQFNAMDNIGSVRLTVQDSSGIISTQHFDYKPFGDTLNAEGESRIGYAAQERDEESRYFAMGARQYDPLTGRFLSVDPLYEQFPDKTPYHYCNNNPVSFKDPSGLSPENEKGREEEVQGSDFEEVLFDVSNKIYEYLAGLVSLNRTVSKSQVDFIKLRWNFFGEESGGSISEGGGSGKRVGSGKNVFLGLLTKGNAGDYAGSMVLPTPKDWKTESIDESCQMAYERLEYMKTFTENEVGFFLKWDENNSILTAEFFYGVAPDNWLFLSETPPAGLEISEGESIIGFVHAHRDLGEGTCTILSWGDISAASNIVLGEYSWMNRPKLCEIIKTGIYTANIGEIYCSDPRVVDRTFFGMIAPNGSRDAFSWLLTSSKYLGDLYHGIWLSGGDQYFGNEHKNRYNVDPWRRKK